MPLAISNIFKGGRITVSSSLATEIYNGDAVAGIQVKADPANSGNIYIGGTNVSSSSYPLSAGEGLFIPFTNTSQLRALAQVNSDKLHYIVL